jgi:hypothetical protein
MPSGNPVWIVTTTPTPRNYVKPGKHRNAYLPDETRPWDVQNMEQEYTRLVFIAHRN